MESTEIKSRVTTVEDALRHWDPIGVIDLRLEDGLPPNEYDSYAPEILSRLEAGADGKQIAQQLANIRSSQIGLGNNMPSEQEQELGEKLVAWKLGGYIKAPDFRFTRYVS